MGQGPDPAIDFSKLNAAERTALSLLARGHTAKSIATLTDRSVGAVNERLREARRKTGVGSSRELARLFAAQENRDEFIGVAPVRDADRDFLPPAAARGWLRKGVIPMSVVFAALLAAAAFIAQPHGPQQSQPRQSQVRPGLKAPSAVLVSGDDAPMPRELHDRIVAESRDPVWAPRVEGELAQWFASRPVIARVTGPVTVYCGRSMCEAFASYPPDTPVDRVNAAWAEIQGKPFADAIASFGLKKQRWSFAPDSFAVFVSR